MAPDSDDDPDRESRSEELSRILDTYTDSPTPDSDNSLNREPLSEETCQSLIETAYEESPQVGFCLDLMIRGGYRYREVVSSLPSELK